MTKSRNLNKPKAKWTPELEGKLRALYPDNTAKVVGSLLGLRVSQIHNKAKALGIEKSDAFWSSDASGRVQRGKHLPSMVATQFKPGLLPWNKGTNWVAGGRSAETRFKKGQMSGAAQHNYAPIGTMRVSKDGYLERKVTDNPALVPARRWTAVHRLVWEAAHGPIPPGYIVTYRTGMKTVIEAEITADRLECISRAEHARRNHPNSRSPEIAKLVQLKGAITRQVNRIQRESRA